MPAKATAAMIPTAYSAVVMPSSRRNRSLSFLTTNLLPRRHPVRRTQGDCGPRPVQHEDVSFFCGWIPPLWMEESFRRGHVVTPRSCRRGGCPQAEPSSTDLDSLLPVSYPLHFAGVLGRARRIRACRGSPVGGH